MKKKFSPSWNASKQPRKQRKYRANAPLHRKGKFLHARLDKALQKKYNIRSVRLTKGDKVLVCRGEHKGKKGEVERVETKRERIFIRGVERTKLDGSKIFLPLHPSNVKIEEVSTKKRRKKIKEKTSTKKEEEPKKVEEKAAPKKQAESSNPEENK